VPIPTTAYFVEMDALPEDREERGRRWGVIAVGGSLTAVVLVVAVLWRLLWGPVTNFH
jgi:hypothetical protein